MAENMVPLPVRVPDQLKQKVADYADEHGLSNSEMGRQLLARGLEVERDGYEPERLEAELEAARDRVDDLEEENSRLRRERENLLQRLEYRPPREQLKSGAVWFLIVGFIFSFASTSSLFQIPYGQLAIELATVSFGFCFAFGIAWAAAVTVRRFSTEEWYRDRALSLQKSKLFQFMFDLPSPGALERIHQPDDGSLSKKKGHTPNENIRT